MLTSALSYGQTGVGGGGQSNVSGGGSGSGVVGGTFGGSPSSLYTFTVSAGTISAVNNKTGTVDYTGTDIAVVLNNVINANASTCGTLFFKNGTYLISSATLESSATNILQAGSLYYSIAFPANAGSANQYCQWRLIGEQAPFVAAIGGVQNAQGVIFKATAAARTAAGASTNMIAYFWHRPDTTNSIGNDVFFENIGFQGVDNQRGNECGFCMYEAATVHYQNVLAVMAPGWGPPNTPLISPAVAGTNRLIAFTSTQNNHNNWQWFQETWAEGADICYDVESEHSVGFAASGLLCSNVGILGRIVQASHPITHPGTWTKFTDQESINGWTFGANMSRGCTINFITYDIEQLTSTAFARVNNFTETNPGYCSGTINYESVNAGIGGTNIYPGALFSNAASGGGSGFVKQQSNTPLTTPNPTVFDNFLGGNAATLAPAWVSCSSNCGALLGVNSATVTPVTATASDNMAAYQGLIVNNDQFSQVKVTGINAADTVGVLTNVPAGASGFPSTRTAYKYVCSTSGGAVPNRAIYKIVANAATLLIQTPAASGCGVGDIIELDHVGTTLNAYYTPSGGTRIKDLTAVDATLSGGYPGISAQSNVLNRTSVSNWVGGNLTAETTNSVGSPNRAIPGDFVSNTYSTLTACAVNSVSPAACGSAASGAFVIPTTTATYTVNTTAVTLNSVIIITPRTYVGNLPSAPTCVVPTITAEPVVSAIVAGTSFTLTETSTTGQTCWNYWIIN
jgi:hypothetical protein